MLDWLVVGGGLQGCHIARRLQAAAAEASVAVMDPAASALTAWRRCADACGMSFLRSSQAHHLGLRSDALRVFARQHGFDGGHALGRYRRPSRALFEAHAAAVTQPIERIPATAQAIEAQDDTCWRVVTADAAYAARNVVLATGPAAPARPDWGKHLPHVFDRSFTQGSAGWSAKDRVVVIGGGISAAQYAIARAKDGHPVTLASRHELRRTAFDSQPCFSGPRCLAPFLRLPPAERPQALAAARNPGTLPADIHTELETLVAAGAVRRVRGEVVSLNDSGPRLADKRAIRADRIVLATGFLPRAGPIIERTARRLQLPLDQQGYARLDEHLAWAPGLYVAGRPASLQLGPMAGNIRGAQLAARRLAAAPAREGGTGLAVSQ